MSIEFVIFASLFSLLLLIVLPIQIREWVLSINHKNSTRILKITNYNEKTVFKVQKKVLGNIWMQGLVKECLIGGLSLKKLVKAEFEDEESAKSFYYNFECLKQNKIREEQEMINKKIRIKEEKRLNKVRTVEIINF